MVKRALLILFFSKQNGKCTIIFVVVVVIINLSFLYHAQTHTQTDGDFVSHWKEMAVPVSATKKRKKN